MGVGVSREDVRTFRGPQGRLKSICNIGFLNGQTFPARVCFEPACNGCEDFSGTFVGEGKITMVVIVFETFFPGTLQHPLVGGRERFEEFPGLVHGDEGVQGCVEGEKGEIELIQPIQYIEVSLIHTPSGMVHPVYEVIQNPGQGVFDHPVEMAAVHGLRNVLHVGGKQARRNTKESYKGD